MVFLTLRDSSWQPVYVKSDGLAGADLLVLYDALSLAVGETVFKNVQWRRVPSEQLDDVPACMRAGAEAVFYPCGSFVCKGCCEIAPMNANAKAWAMADRWDQQAYDGLFCESCSDAMQATECPLKWYPLHAVLQRSAEARVPRLLRRWNAVVRKRHIRRLLMVANRVGVMQPVAEHVLRARVAL